MTTTRSVAASIILGTTLCLTVISAFVHLMADMEFNYAVRTVDRIRRGIPLSALAELVRESYLFTWALPITAAVAGAIIIRRKDYHSAALAWYVSIFALLATIELLALLFVWYGNETEFYH